MHILLKLFAFIIVKQVNIFVNAFKESWAPLGMVAFLMSIAVIIFSSIMYYTERGEWVEELEVSE